MKLTKEAKRNIVTAMMQDILVNSKLPLIEAKLARLGADLYLATIPDAVKETYAKHPEFFVTSSHIRIRRTNDGKDDWWGSDMVISIYDQDINLPIQERRSEARVQYNAQAVELDKQRGALRSSEHELENELESVVFSCTTDKQLLELLPEAAKYITEKDEMKALIPMQAIQKLRADMQRIKEQNS